MGYNEWFEAHAQKHEKIVQKLLNQGYTKEEIVNYFKYENMLKNEYEFCPLYKEGKKCHTMEDLNCYLCACPNFRFDDAGIDMVDGKKRYSLCSINSKDGAAGVYGEKIHQNCSNCTIPHTKEYVMQHFHLQWKEIMKRCKIDGC